MKIKKPSLVLALFVLIVKAEDVPVTAEITFPYNFSIISTSTCQFFFKSQTDNQLLSCTPQHTYSNIHTCTIDLERNQNWQVWADFNGCTVTPGPVITSVGPNFKISFTAIDIQKPEATIIQPTGNVHINILDSIIFSFSDNSQLINRIIYSISYDNGSNWTLITDKNDEWHAQQLGRYQEYTPSSLSSACKIRVIIADLAGNLDTALSPTFACYDTVNPSVQLNQPLELNAGSNYQINWAASDNINLKSWAISISEDGTNFNKIDSASNTTKTCNWAIPDTYLTTTCKIKISVYDLSGNIASDVSDAFSIVDTIKPTVTIISPTTGTSWNIGATYSISWVYTDNSREFKSRAIYIDNVLMDSSSTTENFSWVAAGISSAITIRINVYDPTGNKNTTTRTVSLVDGTNPTIAISEPVGGSSYYSSASLRVRWTASDNGIIAGVSFYLAFNNGDFFYMDSVAGNPEVITLKIPDTIYTNSNTVVQCKIYDTEGNMSSAMSDPFSVKNIFPVSGKISLDSSIVYLEDIDTIKMSFNDRSRIVNYGVNLSTDSGKTFRNLFVQLCSLEPKTVHNLTWLWTVGAYGKGIESDKCFLRFYTGDQQIPSSRDSLTSKMFKIEKRPETSVVKKYIPIKKVPENYTYFSLNGQVRSFSRSSVFFIKADNRVKKSLLIK